jgi:hypothetical protein
MSLSATLSRMKTTQLCFAVVLCGSVSACMFLVSTDELQGGPVRVDASLPPDTGSTILPDTGTPVIDTGAPADVAVEAAPVPFCQTRQAAVFCTDFETATQNFGTRLGNDGTFALDTAQSVSAPTAAFITVNAGNAREYKQVRNAIDLPKNATAKSFTLEASFRPESNPEVQTNVVFAQIIFRSNNQEAGFYWEHRNNGVLRAVGYTDPDTTTGMNEQYEVKDFENVSLNQWHETKVVFTLGNPALGGAGGKFVATVDGASQSQDLPTATNVAEVFLYGAGIYGGEAFAQHKLRLDNLALIPTQ